MKTIQIAKDKARYLQIFIGEHGYEETKEILIRNGKDEETLKEMKTNFLRIDDSVYYLYCRLCDCMEEYAQPGKEEYTIELLDTGVNDLIIYMECIRDKETMDIAYNYCESRLSNKHKPLVSKIINECYESLLECKNQKSVEELEYEI